MEIKRIGLQPSTKGPADWFTGTVRIDPLFQANPPARAAGASVTFEPGARTAWHTHPLGQTLIVVSGCGWAQREGGPVEQIRPGDVVWFPPGETFYLEPMPTMDVDVFVAILPEAGNLMITPKPIYDYLTALGYTPVGEALKVEDWLVQFLPPTGTFVEEASREHERWMLRASDLCIHRRAPGGRRTRIW